MRSLHDAVDVLAQWVGNMPAKPKTKYDGTWTLLFDRAARHFAMQSDMKGPDFRLMMWLVAGDHKLDFVSWRDVPQSEVAKALGVSQPTISRSMKRLAAKGVIERQNRGGGGNKRDVVSRWRMNPFFFWRGKGEQYWPVVRERMLTKQQRASALRAAEGGMLELALPEPARIALARNKSVG